MTTNHGKSPQPPQPHVVDPRGVYTPELLRQLLGFREHTLSREIALGRLRVAKRMGGYLILGRWILDWIKAGEVESRPAPDQGKES